jgi:hypothetical protein
MNARRMFAMLALLPMPLFAQQTNFDCTPPATPGLSNPTVLGNGSAGSVTTTALQAALTAGGNIRLNVGTSTVALRRNCSSRNPRRSTRTARRCPAEVRIACCT